MKKSNIVFLLIVAVALFLFNSSAFALTVNTSDIADGAVTTPKIADGAVTDDKISGPISASKIQDGVFQKKYANVIVVAKSGGDFADPVAAIASIANASSANPYLVKIMPGVYNITSPLIMKDFVDIEGSEETVTKLQSSNIDYVVYGSNNAEIRQLTIDNDRAGTGNQTNIGIWLVNTSPSIRNVTVRCAEAPNGSAAIQIQTSASVISHVTLIAEGPSTDTVALVANINSSITLSDSEARSGRIVIGMTSAAAISNFKSKREVAISGNSSATLTNVTIDSSDMGIATYGDGSTTTIHRSTIGGRIYNHGGSGVMNIAASQVTGQLQVGTGLTMHCFQVYDANFAPITCP